MEPSNTKSKKNPIINFVNLNPSERLKVFLFKTGFDIEVKKFADASHADIVVVQIRSSSDLKVFERLKKKNPNLWLVFVIKKELLLKPYWQKLLLSYTSKNDVLFWEDWESVFPFSVQKFSEQKHVLWSLKKLLLEHTNLKKRCFELSKESSKLIKKLESNLSLALNIQRAIIPKSSPQIPGVSVSVKYIPASGMGGDYYDIFEYGDKKRYGLIVADSKTHGIAATLLSVLLKLSIHEMRERFPNSKSFVDYLNTEIAMNFSKSYENATMSLFFGIFDRSTLNLNLTVAGTVPHILWRRNEAVKLLAHNNPPINKHTQFSFKESSINLLPGDLLLIHTDGIEAPLTCKGEKVEEYLIRFLKEFPPDELHTNIMGMVDSYREKKELPDDITIISFSIHKHALYIAANE